MAKRVVQGDQIVKLLVGAGQASPSPPVGPALGSKGVKSMDFCKEFNARTALYLPGTPIPAVVTVRPDRSFTFTLRSPPTASLLLAAAGAATVKNKVRGAGNTAGSKTLTRLVAAKVATRAVSAPSAEREVDEDDEGEDLDVEASGQGSGMYDVVASGKGNGKDLVGNAKLGTVGTVSLKHVYEIAKIKASENRLAGLGLERIARSVVCQAGSMGVVVVP